MIRLVLLVLYLFASFSSSTTPQNKGGGGWDPFGLNQPSAADYGAGYDPDGELPSSTLTAKAGGGYDPNGRPYGAGYDPNGTSALSPNAPTGDAGAGYDPNGAK